MTSENISRAEHRVAETEEFLLEVPLGGTAVGNGVNTHPDYARLAVAEEGDALIGTLLGSFDGWRGNMYRLVVDPSRRRQGIALAGLSPRGRPQRSRQGSYLCH